MSVATIEVAAPPAREVVPRRATRGVRYVRETALLVGRSLRTMPRVPERLSDVTIQPVVFTLLFLFVFGSAIHVSGMSYQDFLIPGLIGQGIAFGVIGAGVATATDFTSGVIDRFRSLPVTRLSVITAQVIGQMFELMIGMTLYIAVGLIAGWRPHLSLAGTFGLIGLILLGLFAFTWLGVLLGMSVRSADAMQGFGFALVFPLSFLAGAFVPIAGMREVPRVIGEWDPISAFVASMRLLCQGTSTQGSWQLEHPVVAMVGWCVLIIGICVPLALRKFRDTQASA